MNKLVLSDKLQGVIRNPFAYYSPIQKGFSGWIQTVPPDSYYLTSGIFTYFKGYVMVSTVAL